MGLQLKTKGVDVVGIVVCSNKRSEYLHGEG